MAAEVLGRFPIEKRLGFSVETLPADTFAVVRMSGAEELSRPYWFELELLSDNKDIQFAAVMHKAGTLEIVGAGEESTLYHGMVTRFQQLQEVERRALYRVRVEPLMSKARGQVQSEVYLDKTLPGIIDAVLEDSGLGPLDYELRLAGEVTSRSNEYLCQYEESDLDFLQWLLEREGVAYYFADDGEGDFLEPPGGAGDGRQPQAEVSAHLGGQERPHAQGRRAAVRAYGGTAAAVGGGEELRLPQGGVGDSLGGGGVGGWGGPGGAVRGGGGDAGGGRADRGDPGPGDRLPWRDLRG